MTSSPARITDLWSTRPSVGKATKVGSSVRVIEAFIDELDLATLGFDGVVPETTGRPAYHPATPLKIYLYGTLLHGLVVGGEEWTV